MVDFDEMAANLRKTLLCVIIWEIFNWTNIYGRYLYNSEGFDVRVAVANGTAPDLARIGDMTKREGTIGLGVWLSRWR